jgi:hypothetical protein
VFDGTGAVHTAYPFLASDVSAALLAHNAGWISAHTMGSALLDEMLSSSPKQAAAERLGAVTMSHGPAGLPFQDSPVSSRTGRPGGFVQLVHGEVTGFDVSGATVTAVRVTPASHGSGASGSGGTTVLACGAFVNAAGPGLNTVHIRMCDALDSSSALRHRGGDDDSAAASRSSAPHSSSRRLPWAGAAGLAPHSATYRPSSPHALPIVPEVHAKVIFRDPLRVIPRTAPMVICNDAIELPWTPDERAYIRDSVPPAVADRLLTPLPAGAHFRPYGGPDSDVILMIWERWHEGVHALGEPPDPSVEGRLDHEWYPEVCLRGLSRVVPGLRAYFDEGYPAPAAAACSNERSAGSTGGAAATRKKAVVDGGYYTRTRENLPLIGPAPAPHAATHASGCVPNAFLCGAVSGFRIMGCHAAGELAALHALGRLPRAELQVGTDHLQRCDAYADTHAARCSAGGTSGARESARAVAAAAPPADTFAGSRAAGSTLADDSVSISSGGVAASVSSTAASRGAPAIASVRGVARAETDVVQPGDVAAVSAGLYPALMSPLRYQCSLYMHPGGVRDQLLAAGGGQL